MILGFKDQFIKPILAGAKIHTLRDDKNMRWVPGKSIQFYARARQPDMHKFRADGECRSVQDVELERVQLPDVEAYEYNIIIDGRKLTDEEAKQFAINDGFTSLNDLILWFFGVEIVTCQEARFKLRLIHWTPCRY